MNARVASLAIVAFSPFKAADTVIRARKIAPISNAREMIQASSSGSPNVLIAKSVIENHDIIRATITAIPKRMAIAISIIFSFSSLSFISYLLLVKLSEAKLDHYFYMLPVLKLYYLVVLESSRFFELQHL